MNEEDMTEIIGVPLLPWQLFAMLALVDSAGGTLEVPRVSLENVEVTDELTASGRLDGGFTLRLSRKH